MLTFSFPSLFRLSIAWLFSATVAAAQNNQTSAPPLSSEALQNCVNKEVRVLIGDFYFSNSMKSIPDFSMLESRLKIIRSSLEKIGVQEVYFVVPPTKPAIYFDHQRIPSPEDVKNFSTYEKRYMDFLNVLQHSGFKTINLLTAFRKYTQSNDKPLYFYKDTHWGQRGAALAAQLITTDLKQSAPAFLESIQQNPFSTEVERQVKRNGNIEQILEKACPGFKPSGEMVDSVRLVNESTDLLGDSSVNTVLIGTSYSAIRLNTTFSENLSVKLSTNVVNEAIDGGGAYGSLLDIMMKPEYRTSPPKLIIWELPSDELVTGKIRIEDPIYYRQVIPTILQDGRKIASYQNIVPENGILSSKGATSGQRMYLKIHFLDTGTRAFDLQLDYPQNSEQVRITRIQGANTKEYYFDLPEGQQEITSIRISNMGTAKKATIEIFEHP